MPEQVRVVADQQQTAAARTKRSIAAVSASGIGSSGVLIISTSYCESRSSS